MSFVDLTFIPKRETTVEEVNAIMKAAAESDELCGVLGYNDLPLVSCDFNHEWGFSQRMLDTACAMMAAK